VTLLLHTVDGKIGSVNAFFSELIVLADLLPILVQDLGPQVLLKEVSDPAACCVLFADKTYVLLC
jgi:hypothetical protein